MYPENVTVVCAHCLWYMVMHRCTFPPGNLI
jgi:hypothetical protein